MQLLVYLSSALMLLLSGSLALAAASAPRRGSGCSRCFRVLASADSCSGPLAPRQLLLPLSCRQCSYCLPAPVRLSGATRKPIPELRSYFRVTM